jgi:hypothetical protein
MFPSCAARSLRSSSHFILGGVCFFLLFVDIAVFIFYFFSAHAVVVQVKAALLAILLLA